MLANQLLAILFLQRINCDKEIKQHKGKINITIQAMLTF